MSDLECVDNVLVIGANLRLEQPMINLRLRKAQLAGASVSALNVKAFDYNHKTNHSTVSPNEIATILAGALKVILEKNSLEAPSYITNINPSELSINLADKLLDSERSVIVLGEHVINNTQAASIAQMVAEIAKQVNGKTLNLTSSANTLGAQYAHFLPKSKGMNTNEMLAADMSAFLLLDIYPEYDFHHSNSAVEALSKDDVFVVSLNSFNNELVAQYSDVLLPMAAMYETSGSHVNINHDMQSFAAAVKAPEEAKPAWKILKVIADLLELPGFHYENVTQVSEELKHQKIYEHKQDITIDLGKKSSAIETIWMHSAYHSDALLRHAKSLSSSKIGQTNSASMNTATAKELSLECGNTYLGVPVVVSDTVADRCVFVSSNQSTDMRRES